MTIYADSDPNHMTRYFAPGTTLDANMLSALAEELADTEQSLESALSKVVGVPPDSVRPASYFLSFRTLRELDSLVFNCAACAWWFYIRDSSPTSPLICRECSADPDYVLIALEASLGE